MGGGVAYNRRGRVSKDALNQLKLDPFGPSKLFCL